MIELLIVVAVMVILIGIALPVMKTGIEGRKLREAARQVNTGVTLAKALAAETDRFTALVIDVESLPEDMTKLFARRLYLAETPPPYAGDMVGATATVRTSGGPPFYADFDASSSNLTNVAKVGDLIRFNYRNPSYRITSIGPATPPAVIPPAIYTIQFIDPTGLSRPQDGSASYEIIRSPEKSSSTPFELPNGAVMDLNNCGFGLSDLSLSRDCTSGVGRFHRIPAGNLLSADHTERSLLLRCRRGDFWNTEPVWPDQPGRVGSGWDGSQRREVAVRGSSSGHRCLWAVGPGDGGDRVDASSPESAHRDVASVDRRLGEHRGLEFGQSFQPLGFHRAPHRADHDGGECGLPAAVDCDHSVHRWHVLSADLAQRIVLHRDRRGNLR